MHSMAEWYMRGEQYDQAKLSRILDVAQDLKVCDPPPPRGLEGSANNDGTKKITPLYYCYYI